MSYQTRTGRGDPVRAESDLSPFRRRFGGGDIVASLLGMLTALGAIVLLGALFAAGAANVDLQMNLLNQEGALDEVEVVGAVVAAAVIFVSFLLGGIAAGRIARYDGGMNGVGAALWFLLLLAVFAALGAWVGEEYNAFAAADLPNWVAQIDVDEVTTAAIVLSILSILLMFAGGYLGGRIGESYHRRVDAAIVDETVR
ncbi:MAG TPA: hypothetical protein VK990_05590 [Acidimicrobiia bacterium]|nr:hypothetical protein [Acidimicrobiia bacterium]